MMNSTELRIFAEISAINSRIFGMNADNDQRKVLGQSMAYVENDYAAETAALDAIIQQLSQYG
jgi:hypothetical protein